MSAPTTTYAPFPADGFEARWATWDGAHQELLTLGWENEAWTAVGRVARGPGEDVEYVVRLSPLWRVRQFLLFRDLADPDLWLGTDGHGRWGELNGAHRPELDGASDVALACTPFTHSLPIRRLPIQVGHGGELSVLWIDVDTLEVRPTMMRYERPTDRRWRVTSADTGTSVEFDVDEYGLPSDIEGAFRRIT